MPLSIPLRLYLKCGSISFPGYTDSYIKVSYKENMKPYTADFTIEWFQYMENVSRNTKQVVFALGKYPNCALGVTFFFRDELWHMGVHLEGHNYYICPAEIINTWVHFAIVCINGEIKIFKDGILIQDSLFISSSLDYSPPELSIGNFPRPAVKYAFKGCISNFRWIVGKCLYDDDFTVPDRALSVTEDTKLLLLMKNERYMLRDSAMNVCDICIHEGEHVSPSEDSAEGCNRIMWLSTTPFPSA
jgi:hypothetical protein